MVGRRPAIQPSVVIDTVLKFKDQVVCVDENGVKGL